MATPVISARIKGKSYHGVPVLGPVALDVAAGEVVAILGPSGVGKSTLLRIIAGLDQDGAGTVDRPDAMAMVFQEPNLLPWRSVLDNITLVHRTLAPGAARDMLDRVGLAGKEDLFPRQLSLGQQRRLALARAFAGRPEALILDEPFASLDPDTGAAMVALTKSLIDDLRPATLLVTHDQREAAALATRTLRLGGSPATLHDPEAPRA